MKVLKSQTFLFALAFIGLSATAAKAQQANPDGTWVGGTWTLENSVLTISGTGTIPDQCFDLVLDVSHVVINEGITGIGFDVWYHTSVESPILTYDIPASVTTMHAYALDGNPEITQITVHWTETLPAVVGDDYVINRNFGVWKDASTVTLSVPFGTTALYQTPAESEWQNFNIVERGAAGISEITKEQLQIVIDNGELRIENYAGGAVAIYDIAGRSVEARFIAPANNGTQTINISPLPSGVYIVKVGGKTGKFVKE
ncbi:MAG: T9SS type A sorting domain-containing protein [Prevotellaceae bacterium]|jgi:hypothetical protein|nr:T9SS type A sorting domain-containing protein [Prevotellaceae bacterium]